MTSHSPQAEAAALIAEARAMQHPDCRQYPLDAVRLLNRLADALDSATAALAVKREADREALGKWLGSEFGDWDWDTPRDRRILTKIADKLLASDVIREASPVEVTEVMVEAACATDPLWDDYGPESKATSRQAARAALRAALGVVEPKPAPETPDTSSIKPEGARP